MNVAVIVVTISLNTSIVTINVLEGHPSTLLQTCHSQLGMVSSVAGAPNIACRPGIH